ncbi:glycosyltransferase family 39 protein [Photobacterium sp. CCB-ST2H9]|uniref:ArnT family glycosyltransferase n=1 Tax=Photobacterium sp. CCB-ST2H9 TaxID=2912855 RepID=UPI0020066FD7|nr:glycosyltransferase family 39 protein [Photobacterium sp. CCB-ST2H9]UTM60283.1 glycosyltransferase family 39 protein [Photobacterium sp. CCB-ST2H9]
MRMDTEHQGNNFPPYFYLVASIIVAIFMIGVSLYFRPLLPIDETRYTSVAWEMWHGGDWLVPHKNGLPYAHKPPVLFWLINLSWMLFGVNDVATRMIVPLLACCNFFLIYQLGKRLYGKHSQAAELSPLVLLSFCILALYLSMTLFDLLLTVFLLSSVICLLKAAQENKIKWGAVAGFWAGIGVLVKGPVILAYLFPLFVSYPFWRQDGWLPNRKWLVVCLLSIIITAVVALLWAIPAAMQGGEEYAQAIFWGQTAGRVSESFAHARPFYWYVLFLPVLTLPWLFFLGCWRSRIFSQMSQADKFCLSWLVLTVLLFSCFSGKQPHYLLPVFPAMAVFLAAKLNLKLFGKEPLLALLLLILAIAMFSGPWWIGAAFKAAQNPEVHPLWGLVPLFLAVVAIKPAVFQKFRLPVLLLAIPVSVYALLPFVSPVLFQLYDLSELAQQLNKKQTEGHVVAISGNYHGQYQYLGRLEEPLVVIGDKNTEEYLWLAQHPNAWAVIATRNVDTYIEQHAVQIWPYRGRKNVLISAADLFQWPDWKLYTPVIDQKLTEKKVAVNSDLE